MHSINVDTSLNILLQNARLMMLEPQQEEEEEEEAQEEQLAGSGHFFFKIIYQLNFHISI